MPIIVGPIHSSKFCGVFPRVQDLGGDRFLDFHSGRATRVADGPCATWQGAWKAWKFWAPGDPLGNPKMTEMILPLKIDSWLEGDLPLCHLASVNFGGWKFWFPRGPTRKNPHNDFWEKPLIKFDGWKMRKRPKPFWGAWDRGSLGLFSLTKC